MAYMVCVYQKNKVIYPGGPSQPWKIVIVFLEKRPYTFSIGMYNQQFQRTSFLKNGLWPLEG